MNEMRTMPFLVEALYSQKTAGDYGLELIEAKNLREQTGEMGKGSVIAVLDTGADKRHKDLKDKIIGGANFTREGKLHDFTDGNGHGTHVSGIVSSVAPEASLLICKVLDSRGSGSYESIISGIKFATAWEGKDGEKVRVINMSLGGSIHDPRLQKAILNACAKGILVVCAAGNEGDGNENTMELAFPSAYNEPVTVAACDEEGRLAGFSNEHLEIDIIAPGVKVLSTFPNDGYAVLSGTSMATPFISGALALVINIGERQFRRTLTESEIYSLLVKCCCSLGYKKSSEGNGLPKLSKLLEACAT